MLTIELDIFQSCTLDTLEIVFDTTLQTVFMSIFLLLTLTVVMCAIQDIVGVSLAKVFGLEPLLGLCMGSMPLVGGSMMGGPIARSRLSGCCHRCRHLCLRWFQGNRLNLPDLYGRNALRRDFQKCI